MRATKTTIKRIISCLLILSLLPVQLAAAYAQTLDSEFKEMVDPALNNRELSIKYPYFSEEYLREVYNMGLEEFNTAGISSAEETMQVNKMQANEMQTRSSEGLLEEPVFVWEYDKYEPIALHPQAYTEDIIANGRVPSNFDGYSWATASTTNEFEYLRPADTYNKQYLKKPRVTLAAEDFAGVFMPADKTAADYYKGNYTKDSGFFPTDGKISFKASTGIWPGQWEEGTYLGSPYEADYIDPPYIQSARSEYNFLMRQNESNTGADYDQRNAIVVDLVPETLSKPESVRADFADSTKFYSRIGILTVGSRVGFYATVHFSDGSSHSYNPGFADFPYIPLDGTSRDLNMISMENASGTSDPGYPGGDSDSVGYVEMDEVYFDSTTDSGRSFHVYGLPIPDSKRLLSVTGITISAASSHAPVYVLGFSGYKSEVLNPPSGHIEIRAASATDRSITLTWPGKKYDTRREWDSKFTHYYVDVATDREFTNILYTKDISNDPETTRDYVYTQVFDQLEPGTTYFFRAGTKLITSEETLISAPAYLSRTWYNTVGTKAVTYHDGNTDESVYGINGTVPVDTEIYSLDDNVTIAMPDPGFQLYLLSKPSTTYRFLGWVSKFGYTYQAGDIVKMKDLGDGTLTAKWDTGEAPSPVQPSGSGDSEEDPYRIETPDHLLWVMQQSRTNATVFTNKYFKLINNIDMGKAPTNLTSAIGYYRTWTRNPLVNCVFDGNYKTISNLKLKNSNNDHLALGLFGQIRDTVIKNLTVDSINIDAYVFPSVLTADHAAFLYVGGIAALAENSTVENCKVTGDSFIMAVGSKVMAGGVIGATDYGTGVTGASKKPYVLKNVGVDSEVELYVSNVWGNLEKGHHAFLYAGGLIGYVDSHYMQGATNVTILDCYNKALIKAYPEQKPFVAFPYNAESGNGADGNRAVTNAFIYHNSGIGGLIGGQTEVWPTNLEVRRAFNTGVVQVVNQPNWNENGGAVYAGALLGHSGSYGRWLFSSGGFWLRGTAFYTDEPGYITVDGNNHTVTLNGAEDSITANRAFGDLPLSGGEERLVADDYRKTLAQLQSPDIYNEENDGNITSWDPNIWKLAEGAMPELDIRYGVPTSLSFEDFDKEFMLEVGASKKIIPVIQSPSNVTANLEWVSSDPLIVTVDSEGLVTAVAPGTATVTVRSIIDLSVSAAAVITVPGERVTGIAVTDTTPLVIGIGQELTIPNTVQITPDEASIKTYYWVSSNERIATVSGNEIVGVAGGTAYIRAVSDDGGYTSAEQVEVQVASRLVSSIELSINQIDFRITDPTMKYSRTIYAETTSTEEGFPPTNGRLNWSSSNEKVALVRADGTVIAIGEGTAVITASSVDGSNISAQCQVNVAQVRVDSLRALAHETEMTAGSSRRLSVEIVPHDAVNKKLIWESSDTRVATVDQSGVVTMHSSDPDATATITVRSADNSLATASFDLTTRIHLLDIRMIDKSELELLRLGGTKPIGEIEFYPLNAANKNYTFINVNPDIIAVDTVNNTVTGLRLGVGLLQVKSEDGGLVDTVKVQVKDVIKATISFVDKKNPANSANITGKVSVKGFDDVTVVGGKAEVKVFPDTPDDKISFTEMSPNSGQTVYRKVDILQRMAFEGAYTVFLDIDDGTKPYFKMLTLHEKYYTTGNSILKEKNVEKYYDLLTTEHATDSYSKSRLFASIEWGEEAPAPLKIDREFASYTLGPNYENVYKSPRNQEFYKIFEYTYGDTYMKLGDGTTKRIAWQFKPYGSYLDSMALSQLAINLAENPDSAFKSMYRVNLPREVPIVASVNGGHIELAFLYQAPRLTEYGVAMNNNNSELVAKIRAYIDGNGSTGELEQIKKSNSGYFDQEASFSSNLFYAGYMYGDFAFVDNIRQLRKWTFWNDRTEVYETRYYLGKYELWEEEYKLLYSRYQNRGIPVQELEFRVSASKMRAAQNDRMVVNQKYSLFGYNFVINAAFETNMDMKLKFISSNDQLQYLGREYSDSYAYVYTGFGKSVVSGGPYCDGLMYIAVEHPNPGHREVFERMRAGNQIVVLGIRKNFKTADYRQTSYFEKLPDGTSRKLPADRGRVFNMQAAAFGILGGADPWDGFEPIDRASYAPYANNSGVTEKTVISDHKEITEFKMTSGYGWLEPQLVKFGDKQMLIWADDNPLRASIDKIALKYSVYNDATESWSAAKYVNDDGTLDGRFSAGVSKGKVYLVQENAAAPITVGAGMPEVLQSIRIELLTYDEATDSFSARILDEPGSGTTEILYLPNLTTTDSEVVATWLSNDAGDLFGTTGSTTLKKALLTEGLLQVSDVMTTVKPVVSYTTGLVNEGGSLNTALLIDEDRDLSTFADRAVYLKAGDEELLKVCAGETINADQEKTVDYPQLARVNGKLALFWYNSNGNIYYMPDINDTSVVQSVFSQKILPENYVQADDEPLAREYPATPDYNLVEGEDGSLALVYNAGKGLLQEDGSITQGADTYVVFYDLKSQSFAGYSANLSKSGAYIGGTEGFIDAADGSFNIALAEKTNYEYDSEIYTTAKLKTMKIIPTVDLEAEDAVLYCDSDTIIEGQDLSATVYVKNIGELQAEGIKITLTDGQGYSNTTEYPTTILAPEGETRAFTVTYPVPQPLTQRTLSAVVEPMDDFRRDYVMANNTATKVIGGIDLRISEMSSQIVEQYMSVNAAVENNTNKTVPESSVSLYEYDRDDEEVVGSALQTIAIPELGPYESHAFSLMFDTSGINFGSSADKAYIISAEAPSGHYDVKSYNNERLFAVANPYYGKIPFDIAVTGVSYQEDSIEIEVVTGNKLPAANSGNVRIELLQRFEDPDNPVVAGDNIENEITQKIQTTTLSSFNLAIPEIPAYGAASRKVTVPFDPDNLRSGAGYTNFIAAEFTSATQGTPLLDEDNNPYYSNSAFTNLASYAKSSNKEIESLAISGVTLTPAFDKDVTNYTLTGYQASGLALTVTTKEPVAETEPAPLISYAAPSTGGHEKYLISGETQDDIELDYSETMTVTVTANDGTAKTYSFQAPARPLGSNKEVESLVITGATLTPAFSKNVLNYTLTGYQGSGVGLTVTTKAPASPREAAPQISYLVPSAGGQSKTIISGATEADIRLDFGETMTVTVTAEDNSTITYSIRAEDRPSSDSPPGQGPAQPPAPVSNKGDTVTVAGEETVTDNIAQVIVSEADINQAIANQNIGSVTIEVKNTQTAGSQVNLNGQTVKNLENKALDLIVNAGDVQYVIPSREFSIDQVAQQLGVPSEELTKVEVSISMVNVSAEWIDEVKEKLQVGADQLLVTPVNFEITCTAEASDGTKRQVVVDSFTNYVQRMIKIPAGVDPAKVTTAIVIHSDGTVSHVPTSIEIIDGVYYASINSLTNSIYSLINNEAGFADVENHWARGDVVDMASRMVISGTGGGLFDPDRAVTRAEFTSILIRGLGLMNVKVGKTVYKDVASGSWYNGTIDIASAYSLISGYGDGRFGPDDRITREQAMGIMSRAMNLTRLSLDLTGTAQNNFRDTAEISPWAAEAVQRCVLAGIVVGSNNQILPKENLTRAQAVVMIKRLLAKSGLI